MAFNNLLERSEEVIGVHHLYSTFETRQVYRPAKPSIPLAHHRSREWAIKILWSVLAHLGKQSVPALGKSLPRPPSVSACAFPRHWNATEQDDECTACTK